MIARLRGLVRLPDLAKVRGLLASRDLARYEDYVRPAAVAGAMVVASLFIVMFGEGSSSAASDPEMVEAVATADDGHGASSEATAEHGSEATAEASGGHGATETGGHGTEATAEPTAEHGVEATGGHGAEATAEATGGHGAEATAEPTDTHAAEPTATQIATFHLAATATPTAGAVRWTDFVSTQFDVSFKYEVAPDGFALQQVRTPDAERVVMWLLTRGSGPAAIPEDSLPEGMSIEVYEPNPLPKDAEAWVRNSPHSHFGGGFGDLVPATVGGAHGVRYGWAGPEDVVSTVVQFDGRIWVFSATYREVSVGAFDVLLDSVVFWK